MTASIPTYPPRSTRDVQAYDLDDVVEGYQDGLAGVSEPEDNRPAAYRWGWRNAARDHSPTDDGYDHLRRALISLSRMH